uniref:Putative secreted protein n=1 Tax=Ixodes ricinus TaxID=34613 RepID=A0A6B0U244_IXORI
MTSAKLVSFMWRNIMMLLRSSAVGFALFWPAMSGAVPWTDSKMAPSEPMLPLGVTPNPPTRPAHKSLRISP